MKAKRYIAEAIAGDREILDFVKKQCSKYLAESKGNTLWRAIPRRINKYEVVQSHISNRAPMNVPLEFHHYLNSIFEEKFGWPVRNGTFSYSDKEKTYFYGQPYMFFPIGDYKFVWSPNVSDLFGALYSFIPKEYFEHSSSMGVWWKKKPEEAKKVARTLLITYTDKNLVEAIKHRVHLVRDEGCEISFKCGNYVLVDEEYHYLFA